MHGRLVAPPVEPGLRIVDAVSGKHDLPLDEHRLARPLDEQIVAERYLPGERLLLCGRILVDHPDLERRGADLRRAVERPCADRP